jgi:hypothetical protein
VVRGEEIHSENGGSTTVPQEKVDHCESSGIELKLSRRVMILTRLLMNQRLFALRACLVVQMNDSIGDNRGLRPPANLNSLTLRWSGFSDPGSRGPQAQLSSLGLPTCLRVVASIAWIASLTSPRPATSISPAR